MVAQETLKKVIVEYQEFLKTVELQTRDVAFEPKGKYVMVGVRHAGKSYLLYQRARELLAAGHSAEEFCYVVSAHKSLDPAAGAGFLAARRPRVACGCL